MSSRFFTLNMWIFDSLWILEPYKYHRCCFFWTPPKPLKETLFPSNPIAGVLQHGIQLNGTITALEVWRIGRPKVHLKCASPIFGWRHIGHIGNPSWEIRWCEMFLLVGVWDFLVLQKGLLQQQSPWDFSTVVDLQGMC